MLNQALVPGALQHPLAVDAAAVVFDADQNRTGFMLGAQRELARRGFASGHTLSRWLQAVVERIAHQVHEWVSNFFDHRFVQLGLTAHNLKVDLFAQAAGGVAHHAAKAAEGFAHRHHAQAQRAVANFFDQVVHVQVGLDQRHVACFARQQVGTGPGNHQFAQQVDHRVKPVSLHADEAVFFATGLFGFLLLVQGGFHHRRRDPSLGLKEIADFGLLP